MKRILVLTLVFLLLISSLSAKTLSAFRKGDKLVGGGYGYPLLSVTYEKGFSKRIGVGLWITIGRYDKEDDNLINVTPSGDKEYVATYYWQQLYHVLAARSNYHFFTTKKFDSYAGLMLGAAYRNRKDYEFHQVQYDWVWEKDICQEGYSESAMVFAFGFQIGARYYIKKDIGVYFEISKPLLYHFGVTYKFRKDIKSIPGRFF